MKMAGKSELLPGPLEALRRRFERWRSTHRARTRIPERLWKAAADAARTYGLHRTARALPVEYYSLKKRAEQQRAGSGASAAFMELPSLPAGASECTLELEDRAGSKMRVRLKAATPPDLAALCRSFWS